MKENRILKDAAELHQSLYAYGKLKTQEKLLVVSGILLALSNGFSICMLNRDEKKTDGMLLFDAIQTALEKVKLDEKNGKEIIMEQFQFLKTTKALNEINPFLKMTPLKYFAIFLKEKIPFEDIQTSEDYIGRFYSEFMSYENSEGQTLGIILTPAHVTSLFSELLKVSERDVILDPCVGTGGFLIGGLAKQVQGNHLYGYEVQHFMYTVACLNLMIRGCNKVHIRNHDFLEQDATKIRQEIKPTVGMINPPYSLGTSANPKLYEISFINHLLDCIEPGGKVAAIVPTSSMFGKTKEVKQYKKEILERHSLDGVITMNPDTFYGVDTQTVIAIFTAGIPHSKDKQSKFIDFRNDGYEVYSHTGLLPRKEADKRKEYLLDVWFDRAKYERDFCIETHITSEDEWLHSSFYKKEEIPKYEYFEKKVTDYLAFKCVSVLQGRVDLFEGQDSFHNLKKNSIPEDVKWKIFEMNDIFCIQGTKVTEPKELAKGGRIPRICCAGTNNGIEGIYGNQPTEEGHVLTVESATVGNVHYQEVPFISSSHVEKLLLKDRDMNVFIGLFLAAAFAFAIEGKYNYGYKISKKRMKQQIIYLPVTESGNPDYEYMDKYIRNCICDSIQQLNCNL